MNHRGQVLGTMHPNTLQLPSLGAKCSVWLWKQLRIPVNKVNFPRNTQHFGAYFSSVWLRILSWAWISMYEVRKWNEWTRRIFYQHTIEKAETRTYHLPLPQERTWSIGGVTWTYSIPVPEVVVGCWRAHHWVVTWTDRKRQESTQLMIQMVGVHPTWRAGYCWF